METFIERMIVEKNELQDKVTSLSKRTAKIYERLFKCIKAKN